MSLLHVISINDINYQWNKIIECPLIFEKKKYSEQSHKKISNKHYACIFFNEVGKQQFRSELWIPREIILNVRRRWTTILVYYGRKHRTNISRFSLYLYSISMMVKKYITIHDLCLGLYASRFRVRFRVDMVNHTAIKRISSYEHGL